VTFEVLPLRFEFEALDEIHLPVGRTGNVFRGALGDLLRKVACRPDCPGAKDCPHRDACAYARFFEPRLDTGPSGLSDPPRPFVLRPHDAADQTIPPGGWLRLDLHLFDVRTTYLPYLIAALSQLSTTGLGPGRGRAVLRNVFAVNERGAAAEPLFKSGHMLSDVSFCNIRLCLDPKEAICPSVWLRFVTPTEIKSEGKIVPRPEFRILIARLRDRIAGLDQLYGSGQIEFDWKKLEEGAGQVRIVEASLRNAEVERRSSRTGQVHPIGGFTGRVRYEGAIGPFLPLLKAGEWTGVGRQTVWGKGAYVVEAG
jgi:hypothetical protein